MTRQPEIEEHFTVEALAERLHRSAYHVRKLAREGAFPRAVKDGQVWMIPASDVAAWLAARRPFQRVA